LGLAVTALLASTLFIILGWLGICILGLFGLMISQRLELLGGYAMIESSRADTSVNFLARQIEQRRKQTQAEKLQEAENDAERERWLYVVNTICIALVGFGFAMFVRHQI
jgi:hypothetical protein